jgi:hypothetical protein
MDNHLADSRERFCRALSSVQVELCQSEGLALFRQGPVCAKPGCEERSVVRGQEPSVQLKGAG